MYRATFLSSCPSSEVTRSCCPYNALADCTRASPSSPPRPLPTSCGSCMAPPSPSPTPARRAPRALAFCFSGQGGPPLDPRTTSLCGVTTAFTAAVHTCFAHARRRTRRGAQAPRAADRARRHVGRVGRRPCSRGTASASRARRHARAARHALARWRARCAERHGRAAAAPPRSSLAGRAAVHTRVQLACVNAAEPVTPASRGSLLSRARSMTRCAARTRARADVLSTPRLRRHCTCVSPARRPRGYSARCALALARASSAVTSRTSTPASHA